MVTARESKKDTMTQKRVHNRKAIILSLPFPSYFVCFMTSRIEPVVIVILASQCLRATESKVFAPLRQWNSRWRSKRRRRRKSFRWLQPTNPRHSSSEDSEISAGWQQWNCWKYEKTHVISLEHSESERSERKKAMKFLSCWAHERSYKRR